MFVQVLGLGKRYSGYNDKLNWYHDYLSDPSLVADDDVVLLMDGYDVLLFPAIRRAPQVTEPYMTSLRRLHTPLT